MKTTGLVIRDGMSLGQDEKVEVYYNIHKGGFSIKSMDKRNPNNGKVVAYADFVSIDGATFHLSQGKLKQILDKRVKTVYAVVRGIFRHCEQVDNTSHRKGYCNPYVTGKFIDWETKDQLESAASVYFYDKFFSFIR